MSLRGFTVGLALVAGLGSAKLGSAQEQPIPGSDLTVALVTIGPGAKVFERFGHNMLWVRSATAATDSVWDWGRFSFQTERFFLRFAQGDLRYWMKGDPAGIVIPWYQASGRSILIQELNLSPTQRIELLHLLRANDTDAARYYQYDYYLDNCSTRVRDILDRVTGGALRRATDGVTSSWSFRDQTRRLTQHNPFIHFGLTVLLAETTDRKMTGWEEAFLPSELARWVRETSLTGPSGNSVSLVRSEQIVSTGSRFAVPEKPGESWPYTLAVGIGTAVLLVLTSKRRGSPTGRLFVPIAAAYLLVAAVLGVTLALLWAFTNHRVAWGNENLWQFNLAAAALVILLRPLARAKPDSRVATVGRGLAYLLAAISVIGAMLKILPNFDQHNWDVIALALPANLGIAVGVKSWIQTG